MPSLGEPSGDALSDADLKLFAELAVEGDAGVPCSAASAVVATAFALPGMPTSGIRAADSLDALDN